MEIDDDIPSQQPNNKGKSVITSPPPHTKTTPWVEKFRPQSLADVAAHRDIIDTSMLLINLVVLCLKVSN